MCVACGVLLEGKKENATATSELKMSVVSKDDRGGIAGAQSLGLGFWTVTLAATCLHGAERVESFA